MRILVTTILAIFSQALFAESIFMVPGESWGFQFDSPKLISQKGNTSATEYQFKASTADGFIVSAFIEPSNDKGTDSSGCMKHYWALSSRNPSIQKDTVKIISTGSFAVVTYLIDAKYQGTRFIQPNANYYGFRQGKCIDFHVSQIFPYESKIDYKNMLIFGKTFGYFK